LIEDSSDESAAMVRGSGSIHRPPLELRKSKGFKDFKHKLKLFLLDHSFYSTKEFLLEGL
jgi:hypothetical protein